LERELDRRWRAESRDRAGERRAEHRERNERNQTWRAESRERERESKGRYRAENLEPDRERRAESRERERESNRSLARRELRKATRAPGPLAGA